MACSFTSTAPTRSAATPSTTTPRIRRTSSCRCSTTGRLFHQADFLVVPHGARMHGNALERLGHVLRLEQGERGKGGDQILLVVVQGLDDSVDDIVGHLRVGD